MNQGKSNRFASDLLKYVTGQVNNLGAAITPYLALFSVMPALDGTGGTEITGANLARVSSAGSWGAPAVVSGVETVSNNADIALGTPAIDLGTAVGVGIYDAGSGGNLHELIPLRGTRLAFTAAASTDTFTHAAHGYVNGQKVVLESITGLSLPTGVAADTDYYVVGATTNTFQLSLTQGGAAIDLTTDGQGYVRMENAIPINQNQPVKILATQLVISDQ